jgi:hypothetical protein
MTNHTAHIAATDATELLAVFEREFGVTYETAVRHGGATGDDDSRPEPCIAPADLIAMADEEEARETRHRERGWR